MNKSNTFFGQLFKTLLLFIFAILIVNVSVNIVLVTLQNAQNKLNIFKGYVTAPHNWLIQMEQQPISYVSILILSVLGLLFLFLSTSVNYYEFVQPLHSENKYTRAREALLQGARFHILQYLPFYEYMYSQENQTNVSNMLQPKLRVDSALSNTEYCDTNIVTIFCKENNQIALIGAPCSGKTTLMIVLAATLLETITSDSSEPIHVLIPLKNWEQNQLPFQDWLIKQLQEIFNITKISAQMLTAEGGLTLLLDDFDAIEEKVQLDCITAMTQYINQSGANIAITMRPETFNRFSGSLSSLSSVHALPLTEKQIIQFCETKQNKLHNLCAAIQIDPLLMQLASEPGMLYIMSQIYSGANSKDIPRAFNIESLQRTIWEQYALQKLKPEIADHKTGKIRNIFSENQTRKSLNWLAFQMKQNKVSRFYVDNLQFNFIQSRFNASAAAILANIPRAILILVFLYVIIFTNNTFNKYFLYLLDAALIISLMLFIFETIRSLRYINNNKITLPRITFNKGNQVSINYYLGRIFYFIAFGLFATPIAVSFYFFVITWIFNNISENPFSLNLFNLDTIVNFSVIWVPSAIIGIIFFIASITIASNTSKSSKGDFVHVCFTDPNQRIYQKIFVTFADITLTLLFLYSNIIYNFSFLEITIIIFYAIIALTLDSFLDHFLTRIFLAQEGVIPLNFGTFLQFATQRMILRQIGIGFEFIHPSLQEYFLRQYDHSNQKSDFHIDI